MISRYRYDYGEDYEIEKRTRYFSRKKRYRFRTLKIVFPVCFNCYYGKSCWSKWLSSEEECHERAEKKFMQYHPRYFKNNKKKYYTF